MNVKQGYADALLLFMKGWAFRLNRNHAIHLANTVRASDFKNNYDDASLWFLNHGKV